VIIYVMNHRSNADYILVSYALAGHVAISYAVGEWARAFPLEVVFKSFGSYFIRAAIASRSITLCSSGTCSSSRAKE
jgi:glycerol-3-phosphate O-acyltransferase